MVMVATILLGRCWRRFLGISASAPAFVLFNILFLWGVYVSTIRQGSLNLVDPLPGVMCVCCIFVTYLLLQPSLRYWMPFSMLSVLYFCMVFIGVRRFHMLSFIFSLPFNYLLWMPNYGGVGQFPVG